MMSTFYNPIYSITSNFLLVSLFAITLQTVKCDETAFNDVISILQKDYFIKLFFDDVKQTTKLHDVQIPFTLQHYRNGSFRTLNLTVYEKFFHLNRLIGSRTKKVINIVQLNFRKYIKVGATFDKQSPIDVFKFVRGPEYHGLNTHTIILGNGELYEMTSKDTMSMFIVLGPHWVQFNVFLFKFHKQLPLWRVCVLKATTMELVCVDSSAITERSLDSRKIIRRIWVIKFEKYTKFYFLQENRKPHFETPVDDILLNEIFRRSNESLVKSGTYDHFIASEVTLQSNSVLPSGTDTVVVIAEFETNFLSCYSTPILRFEMYAKPFELQLWIYLGTTLTTISVFIYIYNRKQKLSPSFSPFFFFVSTLFEEPYSVPTALWNDSKFKTITIAWLLTAVIFTNLYTGQMIGDLSTPIRDQALYSFTDVFGVYTNAGLSAHPTLDNIYFWSSGNYTGPLQDDNYPFGKDECRGVLDYYHYDTYLQRYRNPDHFALLQAPSTICNAKHINATPQSLRLCVPQMYELFNRLASEEGFNDERFNIFHRAYAHYVTEFFSPRYRPYPKNPEFKYSNNREIQHFMYAAIEKELISCEKSIFLADSNELRTELAYLKQNYPQIKFYVGNETMELGLKRKLVWNFENQGSSRVPYYLKLLLQAGIRDAVLSIQSHRKYVQRRIGTQLIQMEISPTLVDMKGPTQTIFIILAAITSLAALLFQLELMYYNRKTIYKFCVHLVLITIAVSMRICSRISNSLRQCLRLKKH
jgi:hypothetical protein